MPNKKDNTEFEQKFPEHAKLDARKKEHEHIQSFLQWLESEFYFVGDPETQHKKRPVDLIAEYFDVDPKKLEQEKQKMLEDIRNAN